MVTNVEQPVTIRGRLRCPTCKDVPVLVQDQVVPDLLTCQRCGKVAAFLGWVEPVQVTLGDQHDGAGPSGNLRRFTED